MIDYLIVGHVTKDVTPTGYTLGGTVTYAGLTVARLGARVGVVTAASEDIDLASRLPGVDVRVVSSAATTTFENIYAADGRRTQRLLARAREIQFSDVPPEWRQAAIVHLAPLAAEFGPDLITSFPCAQYVALTPQGWMRAWGDDRIVRPINPPDLSPSQRGRLDVVIVSDADFGNRWPKIEDYARSNRLTIVTRGELGARVYADGRTEDFPGFPARVVDPTGAGDVFAAAFLLRLAQSRDRDEAMSFANCVASFSVEGVSTESLPDRDSIAARRSSR